MSRLALIAILLFTTLTAQNGVTCHGPIPGVRYDYEYHTQLVLNNPDNREPAGFQTEVHFSTENIWQNAHSHLDLVTFESLQFKPRPDARSYKFPDGPVVSDFPPVLVHFDGPTGTVQNLYVPKVDKKSHSTSHLLEPTHMNLLVGILNALRSRFSSEELNRIAKTDRNLQRKYEVTETTSNSSLLAPRVFDAWEIQTKLAADHDVAEEVHGWQNVSLESKIFARARSHLYTTFDLKLLREAKVSTGEALTSSDSVQAAVKLYGEKIAKMEMIEFGLHFIAEKRLCEPYFCDSLEKFVSLYEKELSEDDSMATTSMSVAYLRFLEYFRINSASISRKQVGELLKKYARSASKNGHVIKTLLDAIAGSRHGESMMAAFQFLDLPKCQGDSVDLCERFLVAVSISSITTSNMGSSFVAEHSLSAEQLIDLFLPLVSSSSWSDERVEHAFGLTLGTLLNAYKVFEEFAVREQKNVGLSHRIYADTLIARHSSPLYVDVSVVPDGQHPEKAGLQLRVSNSRLNKISEKVVKYLVSRLRACKETDCRIGYLHALGNARVLDKFGVLHDIRDFALNGASRESVAALKALRDIVEHNLSGDGDSRRLNVDKKVLDRLKLLLMRVLYNSKAETTARLIAAELITKYIDHNGDITIELVQKLDSFPTELATMIWKRAVIHVESRVPNDWFRRSTLLSGSSASFKYVMGGTGHCNASYGVMLELLNGKLPKETNFNVELNQEKVVQDIIGVGLFARGLQSFAGGEDEESESSNEISDSEEEESTMAGMSLQILGNQLRPFLFFRSTSELMGHMWSGTGSEMTPVFRANLLLADYYDVRPLVNGFLAEQTLKGMFSLDLSGEVQVSIWNRNSHSNVQTTGAILFQGSQEVHTTDRKTSVRKLFSFGAEAKLNFITDFDFYNSPYRICIQITQPEFIFRHNTRKYEQVHSDALHRRIHRRSYKIAAKSYVLNRDNSEMCALMNQNE